MKKQMILSFLFLVVGLFLNPVWGTDIDDRNSLTDDVRGFDFSSMDAREQQGSEGTDSLIGHGGVDTLYGNGGDDWIYGNRGDDTLYGGSGNDWLSGGPGSDDLFGDEGNDSLVGHRGNDHIHGGSGNDWISGGKGNDILSGGKGNDTFFFIRSSLDMDFISDFTQGQDVIHLKTYDTSFDDLEIKQFEKDVRISLEGYGDIIQISNFNAKDLNPDDFLF